MEKKSSAQRRVSKLEWQDIIGDISGLVWVFEKVEEVRTSLQRRQTHLAKQVICQECLKRFGKRRSIWVPTKTVRMCPRCTKCGRNLAIGRQRVPEKCPQCGGGRCGSKNFVPAGRKDPFIEAYLPQIRKIEQSLRAELELAVQQHSVWQNWAKFVPGIGKITLARILGHCDISRLSTISKMWAHAGLGLDKNGRPQRRQKGKIIDYDLKLQSITTILGESLLRARGKYYDLYLKWKERFLAQGLTRAHAHNRAFRNLRKLAMAHIWEVWRKSKGYPVRTSYAIEYLGHTRQISPEEMIGRQD